MKDNFFKNGSNAPDDLYDKFNDVENLSLDDMEGMMTNPLNLAFMTKLAQPKNKGMAKEDKMAMMKNKMAAKKEEMAKMKKAGEATGIRKK